MERLTVKSAFLEEHYTLNCMCSIDREGGIDEEDSCREYCERYCGEELVVKCETCDIQKAFDKLGEYENTGLSSL